jgi:hypothetical protein
MFSDGTVVNAGQYTVIWNNFYKVDICVGFFKGLTAKVYVSFRLFLLRCGLAIGGYFLDMLYHRMRSAKIHCTLYKRYPI